MNATPLPCHGERSDAIPPVPHCHGEIRLYRRKAVFEVEIT